MTALAAQTSRVLKPSWWEAISAVVVGVIFAFGAMIGLAFVGLAIGMPSPSDGGTNGLVPPWRLEGPWSAVANIGPLLWMGFAFAGGVELMLRDRTSIARWRVPLVVGAAALGALPTEGDGWSVSGWVPFALLVILVRELATRERTPLRWTRLTAGLAVIMGVALIAATLSYGFLHPLSATMDTAVDHRPRDGKLVLSGYLQSHGRPEVRVLATTAPGAETVRFRPGEVVDFDRGRFELVVPCGAIFDVDRLNVRVRVLGRDVDQVVRLNQRPSAGCMT
ncbi:hypothetical protein OJ997_02990 [Solirubrobacter phytolaccae]|uniref:Uncharacterized protein n=1 Tax=Solirubrobacter phytolaccae TaxID=1404360 RepID=A0A9X3N6B8_9ACTN|nr:hypothetical protein [Solirubrobacter phytolaccae]MDA0179250.1 hypothetical protein [Solirubrobacter phytolaccae]